MAIYKVVRTTSGEDIIGKVDDTSPETLINPAIIVIRPGQDGGMNVMMVPFMPFAAGFKSNFPNMNSMINCIPEEGILSEYKKLFDEDAIIVPEKKIILQ